MDFAYYFSSTVFFFVIGGVLLIIEYFIAHGLLALLSTSKKTKGKAKKSHFPNLKLNTNEFIFALVLSYVNGFIFYVLLLPHVPFLQDIFYRSM